MKNDEELTAIQLASRQGYHEIVKLLSHNLANEEQAGYYDDDSSSSEEESFRVDSGDPAARGGAYGATEDSPPMDEEPGAIDTGECRSASFLWFGGGFKRSSEVKLNFGRRGRQ